MEAMTKSSSPFPARKARIREGDGGWLLRTQDTTETPEAEPVVRVAPVTACAAKPDRHGEIPRPAAQNAILACGRPSWISIWRRLVVVLRIPVQTPLPHIPRHVLHAVGTSTLGILSHRCSPLRPGSGIVALARIP